MVRVFTRLGRSSGIVGTGSEIGGIDARREGGIRLVVEAEGEGDVSAEAIDFVLCGVTGEAGP